VSTPSVGDYILFWVLAAAVVGGALFTMTRRNPVAAVMSLVGTFFALAATYASLSAHFLAIIQILVYAGAIMVLFIFVVMILNREEVSPIAGRGIFTRIVGVAAGVYLVWVFVRVVQVGGGPGNRSVAAGVPAAVSETFGTVGAIGDLLFRDFLYPFEAISLLLLVAVVGGVVVSRSHKKELAAEEAAALRKTIEERAHSDFPAAAGVALADPGDAHGGGGGHH
jgi:NADH-quinone oxidoreductase subunit J